MTFPNLIIPGAPKSGTTSIVAILNQHPDIFVSSRKEPRFFISEQIVGLADDDVIKQFLLDTSILTWEKYKEAYIQDAKFKIDASIQYMFYYKTSVFKIKEYLGDPHILMILRNPIERAISNFTFTKKYERCATLVEAIRDEIAGGREQLNSLIHYYKQGLYYEQVKLFKENFTNVTVLFYEDFEKDNLSFINVICDNLGIPQMEKFRPVPLLNTSAELSWFGKLLTSKYSPVRIAYKFILPLFIDNSVLFNKRRSLRARFSKKKDTAEASLKVGDRQFLFDLYKEDVEKLMQLLGIEKSPWKDFS